MKRFIALLALVVMIMTMFSFTTSAMAATKPTATLKSSKNGYTFEGYTWQLKYSLKPNSYKLKNGYYRSYFFSHIFDYYDDNRVDKATYFFKKNTTLTITYAPLYEGRYYNLYGTQYRSSGSSAWKMASVNFSEITVY